MSRRSRSIRLRRVVALGVLSVAAPSCLLIDSLGGEYTIEEGLSAPCDEQAPNQCEAVWSDRYGGTSGIEVAGIASDDSGRLTIVGQFGGQLTLGPAQLESTEADIFVLRVDNEGGSPVAQVWASAGFEQPMAMATGEGRVAVGGRYPAGLEGCPDAGPGLFVILGDQADLLPTSTVCFAGGGEATISSMDVRDGRVFVSGNFDDDLTIGARTLAPDGIDAFAFAIDIMDGTLVGEALHMGGVAEQQAHALVARPGGGYLVGGEAEDALSINGEPGLPTMETDAFLIAVDAAGMPSSVALYGGEDDQAISALSLDDGGLFVGGEIDGGKLTIGQRTVEANVDEAVVGFVAALDAEFVPGGDAEAMWSFAFVAEDVDLISVRATNDAVYVGGVVDGTMRFDDGASSVGGSCVDLVVTRLDRATGLPAHTARCGDRSEQRLIGMAVIPDEDEAFFAATLEGGIDLEKSHQAGPAGKDLLIGMVPPP